ncbi:hypothetical protein EGW08_017447 [Elysia chlorotica]|uniref:L-Fucosyltransferase n=1 Tax=Elysia chlorotica TaxID=188477 RepID=A0A3S0ZH62_ELYCH|nr:hypothetical protein EGW08_017447 [Elysia chlorotica]
MTPRSFTRNRVCIAAILIFVSTWIFRTFFASENMTLVASICNERFKRYSDPTVSLDLQTRTIRPNIKLLYEHEENSVKPNVARASTCSFSDETESKILYKVAELNKLCGKAILPSGLYLGHPRLKFLLVAPRGRLGNQMFLLASSLGISSGQNMAVCLSPELTLPAHFRLREMENINWTGGLSLLKVAERSYAAFDRCLFKLPPSDTRLDGYLQSYKYFHHTRDRVRDYFTFHDATLNSASKILDTLWDRESYPRNITALVGVHVRRKDMKSKINKALGHVLATRTYLFKAFHWMMDELPKKRVVFVVVSDDIAWCERFLSGRYARVAPPASAETHLALLASCDHVIMSVGTFGWWGAWLAGGKVVYYKNYPAPNSPLAKGFNRSDFFLPSWVGLS